MAVANFSPDSQDKDKLNTFQQEYIIKSSELFNDIIVYSLTGFRYLLDEYLKLGEYV